MILWLSYSPDSLSHTPQPLTDEGMVALGEVALATIKDGIGRSTTIEDCPLETKRRALRNGGELICDVTMIKNGRCIGINIHLPHANLLIFFEAQPEEPCSELIN